MSLELYCGQLQDQLFLPAGDYRLLGGHVLSVARGTDAPPLVPADVGRADYMPTLAAPVCVFGAKRGTTYRTCERHHLSIVLLAPSPVGKR